MNSEELWKKFLITGSVKDYIAYKNSLKEGEVDTAFYDGWPGDKGNKYW